MQTLKIGSGYVICPGIPNLPSEIGFKPKKYRQWSLPFVRHDSIDCQLWHKPSHHKRSKDDPMYDSCPPCKLLWHDIGVLLKHAKQIEPLAKSKFQQPSSRKSLKYLSPASKKVRAHLTRLNRKAMMKSLKHYRKYDINLNDDQNAELLKLVSRVSQMLARKNWIKCWLKQMKKGKGSYYAKSGKQMLKKE